MITSLTMFGWIPFTLVLFMVMPPKRAVVWCFFMAWLFLPMAGYQLTGMPDYTKMSASSAGVALGAVLFDQGRLLRFRLRIVDVPIIMFTIVSPMASSISNGLGIYDGISEINGWLGSWTLPWFIGRVYLKTADDMRLVATAFVLGAFVYIPICLWEMRMAPTLHRNIYGFHQHSFAHAIRWGGFRPRGFMQSGLMTALFMCSGAVIALCLWRGRVPVKIFRTAVPMLLAVPFLGLVAIFCKGTGAIVLMFAVVGCLYAGLILRTRLPLILFMAISPLYILARANGIWDGTNMVEFIEGFSRERAHSLNFRFVNENVLIDKAAQRPIFGWGGWNRSAVYNEAGNKNQRVRRPLDHPLRQARRAGHGLLRALAGDAGVDVPVAVQGAPVAQAQRRALHRLGVDARDVLGRLPVQRDGVAAEFPDRRRAVGHAADGPPAGPGGGGAAGGESTGRRRRGGGGRRGLRGFRGRRWFRGSRRCGRAPPAAGADAAARAGPPPRLRTGTLGS